MTASLLRSYLDDGRSRLVVSSYDALTARTVEAAGFEILHLTGFGASAALTGAPDIGLLTMTEMVDACRRVCDAVDLPVIADADTGYGNALNTRRTVRAFEAAGAAGIHLEDQVTPKRCGHMAGKELIPEAEMIAKIKAAVDSRRNDEFVVIARTDARSVEGLERALERAMMYRSAGADVLFVEAPETVVEIERIARELPPPLLFNWAFDGLTPHVSRQSLAELGYSLILFADVASAVHRGFARFLERLHVSDSLDEIATELTPFAEFNRFVGLQLWNELADRYTGRQAVSEESA